jgi:hypothetical protein
MKQVQTGEWLEYAPQLTFPRQVGAATAAAVQSRNKDRKSEAHVMSLRVRIVVPAYRHYGTNRRLPVYDIDMPEMSREFYPCWNAAGKHLSLQVDASPHFWLRAHPNPPYLEHLSFLLGNQLFFIRVEDADGRIEGPGVLAGLYAVARGMGGHACVLPMKRRAFGGSWEAAYPGWGLLDARTRRPINPVALITEEQIEMTPWEVHDMAIQVVREHLRSKGHELMSWQSDPDVDPSIWFIGESGTPEWVVVRAARYPARTARRPENWATIAQSSARLSTIGHFASVPIFSTLQPCKSDDEAPLPLWRGHPMSVDFPGLESQANTRSFEAGRSR